MAGGFYWTPPAEKLKTCYRSPSLPFSSPPLLLPLACLAWASGSNSRDCVYFVSFSLPFLDAFFLWSFAGFNKKKVGVLYGFTVPGSARCFALWALSRALARLRVRVPSLGKLLCFVGNRRRRTRPTLEIRNSRRRSILISIFGDSKLKQKVFLKVELLCVRCVLGLFSSSFFGRLTIGKIDCAFVARELAFCFHFASACHVCCDLRRRRKVL